MPAWNRAGLSSAAGPPARRSRVWLAAAGAGLMPGLRAGEPCDALLGRRGKLGHRVAVAVGDPDVAAAGGDSDGTAELVPGPFQYLDQGPGGGIQLRHRITEVVGDPDVAA